MVKANHLSDVITVHHGRVEVLLPFKYHHGLFKLRHFFVGSSLEVLDIVAFFVRKTFSLEVK